jgi:RsiW-degrading membrane proteinase PrsW (M82 family)
LFVIRIIYAGQPLVIIEVIDMSKEDKEMMNMMTEAIPQMLKSFVLAPYTEESAKQIASAVALFYDEMKKKGFSESFVERLTEVYLGAFRAPLSSPAQLTYKR